MGNNYKLYSSLPELETRKTWAEIDLSALRENYRTLRAAVQTQSLAPRIIAVVKADAYGHGTPECVRALLKEGCDFFAVSSLAEAVAVRNVCQQEKQNADILILGYTTPSLAPRLAQFDVIQSLLSPSYAEELNRAARESGVTVRTHAAIDTGMNRIGYGAHNEEEIRQTVSDIAKWNTPSSHLQVEGIFTHFARADEDEETALSATSLQSDRFLRVRALLSEKGQRNLFAHSCNSAASLLREADCPDGVRLGIVLYGSLPTHRIGISLRPVMKLRTVVSHIHTLLPGEAVGYGGTYRTEEPRTIATLPIGYADGFLRAYSGAYVSLSTTSGTFRVPIVGRVCMDQCMIDVTGTDAAPGDIVTLFGENPEQLAALAKRASTIDYECLCLISSRVLRINTDAAQS